MSAEYPDKYKDGVSVSPMVPWDVASVYLGVATGFPRNQLERLGTTHPPSGSKQISRLYGRLPYRFRHGEGCVHAIVKRTAASATEVRSLIDSWRLSNENFLEQLKDHIQKEPQRNYFFKVGKANHQRWNSS